MYIQVCSATDSDVFWHMIPESVPEKKMYHAPNPLIFLSVIPLFFSYPVKINKCVTMKNR
jgi:hypothetical protein